MLTIERNCRSAADRKKFIKECESEFAKRLDRACKECSSRAPRVIALSGPTCSGKTTASHKIAAELSKNGKDVHSISIDNFFKERDILNRENEMSGGARLDYDSINAIDFELFDHCTSEILAGHETVLPRYDFAGGTRVSGETIKLGENSVIIFEGIQAVYPEVVALMGDDVVSVSVNVEDDLEFNDIIFNRRDIRLMRRLVRDYRFRGAEPEFTFYLWRSVVLNEERSILPHEEKIDIRIDSLIPYEVMLMKSELTPILEKVSDTSRFYAKALEYIERLERIDIVTPDMVPEGSLLREFIGE